MTRHQGGDDGDDMVPFDDVGARDGDDVHEDGASKKKKKGTKAKTDKSKDKKPAKPIEDYYEGYMITVLDQIKDGDSPSWIKTRKVILPVASKELREQAIAHQKATGYNMSGQFQRLSSSQQTIVNRLVDEKNANEKESNAQWVLFGVKRIIQEERRSAFRSMKVNRSMRVTIKRQDKAKNAVQESNSGAMYAGEDIIDISQPVKAPKKATAVSGEKEEKKKPKKPKKVSEVEEDFQGWTNVPEAPGPEQGDFYNQFPQPQPPNQPQEFFDPAWNMPDPQGPIPVPQQFADQRIPPPVPMPPHSLPRQHQQPQGNPFQPRPDVWPQPVPHEVPLEGFPDRHPRGVSAHSARPSARHPSQSRSREDINRANRRRRESLENEKLRQFEAKLERNSDKMDEIVDMVRMAAATKKVNDWPTNSPSGSDYSHSTFHDDIWTDGSGGRDYATPATSPDRDRDRTRKYADRPPMGSLQRRNTFSPGPGKRYYEDRRRGGYREPHYVEPAVSHRAGRDRLRDPRVPVDDYPGDQPRYVERPRAQRRVTHHAEGLPRARFVEGRNRYEPVYDEPAPGRRGGGRYH